MERSKVLVFPFIATACRENRSPACLSKSILALTPRRIERFVNPR